MSVNKNWSNIRFYFQDEKHIFTLFDSNIKKKKMNSEG